MVKIFSVEQKSIAAKKGILPSDILLSINDNEINAFITAGNVSEVYGLWGDKNRIKHTSK